MIDLWGRFVKLLRAWWESGVPADRAKVTVPDDWPKITAPEDGAVAAMAVHDPVINYTTGTCGAMGVNEIVAAPGAGKNLVIQRILLQNESARITQCLISEVAVTKFRWLAKARGVLNLYWESSCEFRLADEHALNLYLAGPQTFSYSIEYWEE